MISFCRTENLTKRYYKFFNPLTLFRLFKMGVYRLRVSKRPIPKICHAYATMMKPNTVSP